MASDGMEYVTNQLSKTKVTGNGVSFVGKSMKLNDAKDAKVVTDAIAECVNMDFLNLEGNTLGVDAAMAIGKALKTHPELKRALWKDMFTGRMKDEIPQALRYLGSGLDIAGARLVELDLSDNAFGPIGMEGLASLLRSRVCYSLQELRLNNNGLGITGAKLLSKALMDCHNNSKADGKSLPLRVFIAGRNRLENDGITHLSKVFKQLGTLEEIQIPQNGIYHKGVHELSEALKANSGLRVLNLNDNTVGPKGSIVLAAALRDLQQLRTLNLGDCLLRTRGALSLAEGLRPGHAHLEVLILDGNEIKKTGGVAIVKAVENKNKLTTLSLNENVFGKDGVLQIKEEMKKSMHPNALGSLSDDEVDEDEDDSQEEETEEEEESDTEDSGSENQVCLKSRTSLNNVSVEEQSVVTTESSLEEAMMNLLKKVTAADFLQFPTPERFLALGPNKGQQILNELKNTSGKGEDYVEKLLGAVMKVGSLAAEQATGQAALDCSVMLYNHLFSGNEINLSIINNALLVHLGLIKSEDKKWKPTYNQKGCHLALEKAMAQNFFPQASKDTINFFLHRKQQTIQTITIP